jgi:hypothetical protein
MAACLAAATELTAHEWGTFTSVAGPDGQAVAWLPLRASTDLPAFVEHFRDENFKCGLSETVRMETPVLYFYSPRETTVSVNVSFAKGIITEWYPHASAVERTDTDGSIRWKEVCLLPGSQAAFPSSNGDNHYYAARNTAATPLRVKAPGGDRDEKFLFYRGVSSAALPIAARLTEEGKVLVQNLGTEEIPSVMLIESRDGRLGYRVSGHQACAGEHGEGVCGAPGTGDAGDRERRRAGVCGTRSTGARQVQALPGAHFERGDCERPGRSSPDEGAAGLPEFRLFLRLPISDMLS